MNEKMLERIGQVASFMSIMMYVSYVPQIMNNLDGSKGNPVQPLVAMINCIVWTIYGAGKKKKDWPIICANVPGIFLGAITAWTAIF